MEFIFIVGDLIIGFAGGVWYARTHAAQVTADVLKLKLDASKAEEVGAAITAKLKGKS